LLGVCACLSLDAHGGFDGGQLLQTLHQVEQKTPGFLELWQGMTGGRRKCLGVRVGGEGGRGGTFSGSRFRSMLFKATNKLSLQGGGGGVEVTGSVRTAATTSAVPAVIRGAAEAKIVSVSNYCKHHIGWQFDSGQSLGRQRLHLARALLHDEHDANNLTFHTRNCGGGGV
jgi:hypothetical protein